jgi:hypothetical protein
MSFYESHSKNAGCKYLASVVRKGPLLPQKRPRQNHTLRGGACERGEISIVEFRAMAIRLRGDTVA